MGTQEIDSFVEHFSDATLNACYVDNTVVAGKSRVVPTYKRLIFICMRIINIKGTSY